MGGAQKEIRVRQSVCVGEFGNTQGFDFARCIHQAPAHVVSYLADEGIGLNGVAERIGLGIQLFRRAHAPEVDGLGWAGLRRKPQRLQRVAQRLAVAVIGRVLNVQLHGAPTVARFA